ncbi:MAG: response regulator, partial [Spirochaetales bacterium]|nr:response regulator [Spirochaetales bacterium]
VEDDKTVQAMTRKTLEMHGYTVLVADEASGAIELCGRNEYTIDVILTDVIMPGEKNGFELADWVADNLPDIKVIYMSGYTDGASAIEEAIRQNNAFLKKPFSAKALLETLREVCDR